MPKHDLSRIRSNSHRLTVLIRKQLNLPDLEQHAYVHTIAAEKSLLWRLTDTTSVNART